MKNVHHPQSWEPPGGLPGRRSSGPWGQAASLRLLVPWDDWMVPGAGRDMEGPDTQGHSHGCWAWTPRAGFPMLLRGDFNSPWQMQLKSSGTFLTVVGKPQTCFQPFHAQQCLLTVLVVGVGHFRVRHQTPQDGRRLTCPPCSLVSRAAAGPGAVLGLGEVTFSAPGSGSARLRG